MSALFIVPYIQLVFGLECASRSLRRLPFQARGKYDVTICLAVIVLMLIGTWIPSHIHPEVDRCFASLMRFISRYGKEGFILLTIIAVLAIISAITIFVRLSTVTSINEDQRIAASRMVYYLVLGIVSLVSLNMRNE
jgi:di/tricarboxylate transporter